MPGFCTDYSPSGLIFPKASADTLEDPGFKPSSGDKRQQQRQLSKQSHLMGGGKKRATRGKGCLLLAPYPSVLFLPPVSGDRVGR
jgi:hypothetical protein